MADLFHHGERQWLGDSTIQQVTETGQEDQPEDDLTKAWDIQSTADILHRTLAAALKEEEENSRTFNTLTLVYRGASIIAIPAGRWRRSTTQ
jgi:hypothetical protein